MLPKEKGKSPFYSVRLKIRDFTKISPNTVRRSQAGFSQPKITSKAEVNQDTRFFSQGHRPNTTEENQEISSSGPIQGSTQHIAAEAAKLCIRALRDSADVFPPLKSLVGGILFFIENHEKWRANRENLERLIARISRLAASSRLATPSDTDSAEKLRRDELEIKFSEISYFLEDLKGGKQIFKYVMANDESSILLGITEDINNAIIDYQLSLQQETNSYISKLIKEADMTILDRLPRAKGAGYQSREPTAGCEPGTRIDILNKLEVWRLYASGQLGASFFCSRDFSDRSDIRLIFPTLAFQLARRYPTFCLYVVEVLKTHPDLGSESMITQLTELLVKPLQASGISATITIDALDESKDPEPASTILSLLARVIDQIPKVKFFVTGRPEAPIRTAFRIPALKPHTEIIVLHEVAESDVDRDIFLYIHARLSNLVTNRSDLDVSQPWPPQNQVNALVSKSAKYFIFASTCVRMISSPSPSDPVEVLEKLTESGSTLLEGTNGIDDLYANILIKAFSPDLIGSTELRLILSTVVLLYNPLSPQSLSDFLGIRRLTTRLGGLHSLLSIDAKRIRVHHKSFSDYLTNRQRCLNDLFYIDPTIYHSDIAISCLEHMKKHLRKNICSLPRYSMNSVMPIATRRKCIGDTLEYSCRFWVRHICQAAQNGAHISQLLPILSEFLQKRQILWLEVLSVLDDIHHSVSSLKELEEWLLKVTGTRDEMKIVEAALLWLDDSLLLLLRFVECLQHSSWHLYHSALLLAPTSSLLRIANKQDLISEGVLLRGRDLWDVRRVFNVDTGVHPDKVIFSHNGTMLAAVCSDGYKVFDVLTGKRLHILKDGRLNESFLTVVRFVAKDSMLLAGKRGGASLWDLHTGSHIRSYDAAVCGPHARNFVDMSPNQRYIALSQYGTVYVWQTASGVLLHKSHINVTVNVESDIDVDVYFMAFSSSSDSLLISYKGVIQVNKFLEGKTDYFEGRHEFRNFAISDDRTLLAAWISTSLGTRISLYDTRIGQVIWTHHWSGNQLDIVSILPHEHTIGMFSESLFQLVDYTTSNIGLIAQHNLPSGDMYSAVVTSDHRYVAYCDIERSGAYIHQMRNLHGSRSLGQNLGYYSTCVTLDGTTGVAWQQGSGNIRVSSVLKDIVLESPQVLESLWSASLTPDRKFIAIVSSCKRRFIVQFWDLSQASLAWVLHLPHRNFAFSFQFVDDDTYLVSSGAILETSGFGFSTSCQLRNTTPTKSVFGGTGSTWHLDMPQSTSRAACLIKIKVSESDCQRVYHLNATAYISPLPQPRYYSKPLDIEGWLIEKQEHKIIWVPRDLRMTGLSATEWITGDIFATAGSSGVITAIDFSGVQDVIMEDSAESWIGHQEKISTYIRSLQEIPWVDEAELSSGEREV